jgi:hypothetical protein
MTVEKAIEWARGNSWPLDKNDDRDFRVIEDIMDAFADEVDRLRETVAIQEVLILGEGKANQALRDEVGRINNLLDITTNDYNQVHDKLLLSEAELDNYKLRWEIEKQNRTQGR